MAFLFEDISQEVTLTRKFRGDLDLYQSIIDDSPEALAIFGRDGRFVLGNTAYRAMWPDAAATVSEATGIWQQACVPTPLWGEIRDFVGGYADRSAWTDRVVLNDGGCLVCRLAPLKGGASLVAFLQGAAPLTTPAPEIEPPQSEAELISSS